MTFRYEDLSFFLQLSEPCGTSGIAQTTNEKRAENAALEEQKRHTQELESLAMEKT